MAPHKSQAESFSLSRWLNDGIQRAQCEGIEFARRLGFTGTSIKTLAREVEDEYEWWEARNYRLYMMNGVIIPNNPKWRRVRCLNALSTILHPFSYEDAEDAKMIDKQLSVLRKLCDTAAPRDEYDTFMAQYGSLWASRQSSKGHFQDAQQQR